MGQPRGCYEIPFVGREVHALALGLSGGVFQGFGHLFGIGAVGGAVFGKLHEKLQLFGGDVGQLRVV